MEEQVYPLLQTAATLLSEDASFFLINSYTTGLAPAVLSYMLQDVLGSRGGTIESSEIGLPVTASGAILPCGATGRWSCG